MNISIFDVTKRVVWYMGVRAHFHILGVLGVFDLGLLLESTEIYTVHMAKYSQNIKISIIKNVVVLKSSIFDIQKIETSMFYIMKNMEIYTFIINKSKN